MKISHILNLFFPPVLFKVFYKIRFFIENVGPRKNTSTISKIRKKSNGLVVIGNGPSLNETFQKYGDKICLYDCIAVNSFCESDYYQQIKPRFYLLADSDYFGDIDSYFDYEKEKIMRFIEKFIENTQWDINLIVPSYAVGSGFINRILDNKFIHPFYYNYRDLVQYNESSKFFFWDKNLLSVPSQTCLNTCVWLGVFLRYKEIYIIGADTNWTELLHVDQNTNEVYIVDTHFYGQKKCPLYKDNEGKIPVKLYEELYSNAKALELYWDLRAYADYAGVKVYNASEYSLIDAFERRRLDFS